jgi:hypothetical protein
MWWEIEIERIVKLFGNEFDLDRKLEFYQNLFDLLKKARAEAAIDTARKMSKTLGDVEKRVREIEERTSSSSSKEGDDDTIWLCRELRRRSQ